MSRSSKATTALLRVLRARVRGWPGGVIIWRLLVTVVGGVLSIGGLLLVPLPGPGWLIVFLGLAVLGTEFAWAARLLTFARAKVATVTAWLRTRARWIKGAITVITAILVVAVVGVYLALNGWWPFDAGKSAAGPARVS